MLAELRFYRGEKTANGSGDYSAFSTDRSGLFYNRIASPISTPFSPSPFVDDGLNSIAAFGVDRITGLVMLMSAPTGSTVISPITSIIYETGDQALVKRALQLDNSGFALRDTGRDLRTFSWVQALGSSIEADVNDAQRLRASNIRLLALLHGIQQFGYGPGYPFYFQSMGIIPPDGVELAKIIKANPRMPLYTMANVETVLRAWPHNQNNSLSYRDDVIAAAARLITLYCVAVGPLTTDDDIAGWYMLGIHGYLLPTLWELSSANSAEAAIRANAISITDMQQAVAEERPAISSTTLFAVPDFLFVPVGGAATIPFYDPGSNGSPSLASNDVSWFVQRDPYPLSLTGITLPTRFASALSVTRQPDQSVLIQAKPGFTGLAWFDYDEQTLGGVVSTGRAYVVVK